MVRKNRGMYGFLCPSWVLITMPSLRKYPGSNVVIVSCCTINSTYEYLVQLQLYLVQLQLYRTIRFRSENPPHLSCPMTLRKCKDRLD